MGTEKGAKTIEARGRDGWVKFLRSLGFESVESVRAGKYMEIRLDEESEEAASRKTDEMCDKLLANPIIEDYRYELEKLSDG